MLRFSNTFQELRLRKAAMYLGYNTNGFAHHRIEDALTILAEIGYRGVALTLEHEFFDPLAADPVGLCVARVRPLVDGLRLRVTIETGSRFLLDPRRKHQPTLVSADEDDRRRRREFLLRAIDVAAELNAEAVSLWSGVPDDHASPAEIMRRLVGELLSLLAYAASRMVRLAFEPEPDMFIQTMAQYEEVYRAVSHPNFGLTLDVGHVHCLNDGDLRDHAQRWRKAMWNVHVEDMRQGKHEHLMFGDGEVDIPGALAVLRSVNYAGPVHVELSRHSHDAVETARRAYQQLSGYFASA